MFYLKFIYYDEKTRKFTTKYDSHKDLYVLKGIVDSLKKQYPLNSYDIQTCPSRYNVFL